MKLQVGILRCLVWCAIVSCSRTVDASPPHPSIPAAGTLDGLGVSIHFTEPLPGELEMIRAAGFKWIRVDLLWADVEKRKGEYDYTVFDGFVAALEKHGLRALFILDYGNPLYGDPDEEFPFTRRVASPEFRAAYARWAATTAARYAGKGFLWELWNEPNLPAFWQPEPDVQQYIALMKEAGQAIRHAAPGEAIVGPATAGIEYAFPFLRSCFEAGLLELFDAVSVHTYRREGPEDVGDEYRALRLLIARHAPAGRTIPIICTEWGYSTATPDPNAQWAQYLADEETQAKYFTRIVLANMAADVPLTIWYDWRDDGDNPGDEQHRFGLVRREHRPKANPSFAPKPAYRAAQALTKTLEGWRFNKRLNLPAQEGASQPQLWLFTRPEAELLAAWNAAPDGSPTLLPLGGGPMSVSDLFGQPLEWKSPAIPPSRCVAAQLDDSVRFFRPLTRDPVLQLAAAWPRLPLEHAGPAPLEETRDLQFINPLAKPLRVAGSSELIPPGGKVPSGVRILAGTQLAPGASGQERADRRRVTATLNLETPLFPLGQEMEICITNPIEFTMATPGPAGLPLLFSNAAGAAWSASARAVSTATGSRYPKGDSWWDVRLSASQEQTVILPLPLPDADQPLHLQIWDHSLAGASTRPIPRPIQGFSAESLSHFTYGDESVAGEVQLKPAGAEAASPSGGPAVRIQYRFGKGHKYAHMQPHGEHFPRRIPTSAKAFGLWVHGDGRGCITRIRFVDSQGQTFQSDGPRLDFTGWRFLVFPVLSSPTAPLASWGGPGDGSVRHPADWDTLLLLDNISQEAVEGAVLIGSPAWIE